MAAPAEFVGRPASPGVALGAVVPLQAGPAAAGREAGEPAAERAALAAAIAEAVAALRRLQADQDTAAAAILDFQVEMLEDPALAAPAEERIAAGEPAASAWRAALGEQVAGYEAAGDNYFRARASDISDLRDRVLQALGEGVAAATERGAIYVGEDLTPSRFLEIDWSQGGGVALGAGSPASHVAMLARTAGVPMVVGLGAVPLAGHLEAVVDGDAGRLILSPAAAERARLAGRSAGAAATRRRFDAAALGPAMTADGRRVTILLNVAHPAELAALDPAICDGIGVVRTEVLFYAAGGAAGGLPGETAQYLAYRRLMEWADGRPVTVRTLDVGGDKPIAGLTPEGESNPFLGLRGVRLSLARPEVFAVQLRALARAAVHGDLKVMLPMVTVPEELAAAGRLFAEAVAALRAAGVPCRLPPLGMMVEVPAAALAIGRFDAAFYSIGTNDLTQYVTAAGRDIASVADLADPTNPAVLRLIAEVARHGAASGRQVSVCGDMAGEPRYAAALLEAGIDVLSMAPNAVGPVKAALAGLRAGVGRSGGNP